VTRLPCRSCGAPVDETFVDLGFQPLANAYLTAQDLHRPQVFHPLHAFLCTRCFLVQLPQAERPEEIFRQYAYFSSVSASWVEHARRYAEAMIGRLGLGPASRVVEIASNDGYLLQHFHARGIPVLGVEPAANIAQAARERGIPTETAFFGRALARELAAQGQRADLLVGNNVLAHVPDLNDFVAGLALLLAPGGILTLEFPHLLRLLQEHQFDTIYHEHFSYFSFHTVRRVAAAHGLTLWDVEELPTHGGSLRIFARHGAERPAETPAVGELLAREERAGLLDRATYRAFTGAVEAIKGQLLRFLLDAREQGRTVAGYGAPAKGNTLLNYCGVGPELLPFTVDLSPHKQGLFLPGTRIPIHPPEKIFETRPDYVLILPWNLKDEITGQMAAVRSWGGRFVVAIPRVEVLG
jgi:2-polyprenyl-3-methyl-5-hydroxy-6-metoxy-1,4-benzoquinol methylase